MLRHKTDDNLLDGKGKFFEERRRLIKAFYYASLPYIEVLEGNKDNADIVKAKVIDMFLEGIKALNLEIPRQIKHQDHSESKAIDFNKLAKDQAISRSHYYSN